MGCIQHSIVLHSRRLTTAYCELHWVLHKYTSAPENKWPLNLRDGSFIGNSDNDFNQPSKNLIQIVLGLSSLRQNLKVENDPIEINGNNGLIGIILRNEWTVFGKLSISKMARNNNN